MWRRPVAENAPRARRVSERLGAWSSRPLTRWLLIVVLLLADFAALLLNDQPGLAFSTYALVPVLLAVSWFGPAAGLIAATAATVLFLGDGLLHSEAGLAGGDLALAAFNRATVFYGVAVLVTLLLRRDRVLTLRLREQQEELAELESLRAALTPSGVPARSGLEFATAFVPADGELAGDFFLVTEGPGDSTTVVVGDVVGHGLEAARCAAFAHAVLATFARFTADPVQLLHLANTALLEQGEPSSQFVTAVCLNIGASPAGLVRWAAAGHAAPWYLDSGAPIPGGRVGTPLGIGVDTFTVEAWHIDLAPGAGVLLFTDGLVEGRSARRARRTTLELFGEERARAVVQQLRGAPAPQVLDGLVAAVDDFVHGPLADDLCLVAVRVERSEQTTQQPAVAG